MMQDSLLNAHKITRSWLALRNELPPPPNNENDSERSSEIRNVLHTVSEKLPVSFKRWIKRGYWQLTKHRIKPINPTKKLGLGRDALRNAKLPDNRIAVLYILPWIQLGGVERVFLQILQYIDRDKFAIYMITTLPSPNEWAYKFNPYVDYLFHLPDFCRSESDQLDFVLDLIDVCKIRIVHVSNSQAGYRFMHNIKRHNPDVLALDTLHMEEPYEAWDYFRYSVRFMDAFDKRVVITPHLSQRLEKVYGENKEKIVVIPNGIDLSLYQKRDELMPRSPLILFAGRLVQQKQPLAFVQIANLLHQRDPELQFAIVGTGPLLPEVQSELNRLCLSAIVSVQIDIMDLRLTLESATIIVAPSLREGLPIVGLEAMAVGVPIIASRVMGWSDLIEDRMDGILVDRSDPEGFVQAVIDLMSEKTLYFNIVNRARCKVESCYNANQMSHAYQMLYNNEEVKVNG